MELLNFGWNNQTYVFLATLSVVLFGTWGLYGQAKKIWANRSGKSVSVVLISVLSFLYLSFVFYGVEKLSVACITQGVLRTALCVPIMLGLYRFKGFKMKEVILNILMCMVFVCMMFIQQIPLMFLVFNIASAIVAIFLPWEMVKEKSHGVVSMKLLVTSLTSFLFWLWYGIVFRDLIIIGTTTSLSIIFATSIVIWIYYWKKEKISVKV
ncbi:MAG: hypothetical protein ISR98_01705, partial [Parcubacteria group bacterium]|nr:hypothetical protein [Parcubacteria group bacterium]